MNKKKLILDSVVTGLGLLTIIFMALPYFIASGFDFLSVGAEAPVVMIGALFTLLSGILMLGAGVVGILGDANVIKANGVKKAFSVVQLIATILAVVAFVLVMVGALMISPEIFVAIGAGFILNIMIAIAALICGILAFKSAKKN